MFILLVIEDFKCLHQQVDEFFHQCANMVWGVKGTLGPPLLVLCTFYKQKVSMALKRAQMIFILKHVIVVNEGLFRLGVFLGGLPFLYLICFSRLKGVQRLDVPLVVCPFRWFICFLGCGSSILFLVSPFFWVLWLIYGWQGFINRVLHIKWNKTPRANRRNLYTSKRI